MIEVLPNPVAPVAPVNEPEVDTSEEELVEVFDDLPEVGKIVICRATSEGSLKTWISNARLDA